MTGSISPATGPSDALRRGDLFDLACPTRELLDRLGTKWTSMAVKVLAAAHPGEVRFAEMRRRMPGVSHKMLSATLQSLTRDGLVTRRVEASVPPKVHYALSDLGVSLEAPLALLREWAESNMAAVDRAGAAWDSTALGAAEGMQTGTDSAER